MRNVNEGVKLEDVRWASDLICPVFNLFYVMKPLLFAIVVFVIQISLSTAHGRQSILFGDDGITFPQFLHLLSVMTAAFAIIQLLRWTKARAEVEIERCKKAKTPNPIRKAVYRRLRYIEQDHVVFDPETGSEVPADADLVLILLDVLSSREGGEPL